MIKIFKIRQEGVRMNNKNEKKNYRRWNIQVCELLQVLIEAAIERCFEK